MSFCFSWNLGILLTFLSPCRAPFDAFTHSIHSGRMDMLWVLLVKRIWWDLENMPFSSPVSSLWIILPPEIWIAPLCWSVTKFCRPGFVPGLGASVVWRAPHLVYASDLGWCCSAAVHFNFCNVYNCFILILSATQSHLFIWAAISWIF